MCWQAAATDLGLPTGSGCRPAPFPAIADRPGISTSNDVCRWRSKASIVPKLHDENRDSSTKSQE